MQMLATKSCMNPSTNQISVPDSRNAIRVHGTGKRIFWCNNGEFEYTNKGNLHGDQKADLKSEDGKWKGTMSFRPEDGKPEWKLVKTTSNKTLTVIAEQRPQARKPAANKSPMSQDRREVVSTSGSYKTKIHYVLRTNVTSGELPTSCSGNKDAIVPFTATYTFVSCSPKCKKWTQKDNLGTGALRLLHRPNCSAILVCEDERRFKFSAGKKIDVNKCSK